MSSFFTRTTLLVILLLSQFSSFAQDSTYPKPQNPPKLVNDFAEVMSYSEVLWLENKLVKFDKETSTQITLITVNSTNSIDIADYAIETGNQWGIGRAKKNNGVLILAAMKDHKVTIMTGYGLEGALPDVLCKQIIDNEITPAFKESEFYNGFDRATDAVISATKGKYKAEGHYGRSGGGMPRWLIILLLIVGINGVLIGLPLLIRYLVEKIRGKKFKRSTYEYTGSTTTIEEEPKPSDNNSSGGSGDENFGGYGGGRFGGGGATGSW
jgi:uncharacterized protein